MFARFVLIAAATLVCTSAHAAEPAKAERQAQAHAQASHPPVVVLASAEEAHAAPAADQQTPATPKRRVARVTTCRCGDPQAQPEQ